MEPRALRGQPPSSCSHKRAWKVLLEHALPLKACLQLLHGEPSATQIPLSSNSSACTGDVLFLTIHASTAPISLTLALCPSVLQPPASLHGAVIPHWNTSASPCWAGRLEPSLRSPHGHGQSRLVGSPCMSSSKPSAQEGPSSHYVTRCDDAQGIQEAHTSLTERCPAQAKPWWAAPHSQLELRAQRNLPGSAFGTSPRVPARDRLQGPEAQHLEGAQGRSQRYCCEPRV